MVEVLRLAPDQGIVDPYSLIDNLRTGQRSLSPFGSEIVDFIRDLSHSLRHHPLVREYPAMGALAYWIRSSRISEIRRHWDHLSSLPEIVRVSRGVVFHVPPTNVDTMFVYSWLLSALVGNANIIRIAPASARVNGPVLETALEALDRNDLVRDTTAFVSYGHDDKVTSALSTADVRVIWGGDETIKAIKGLSSPPRSTELAFPDRFSYAVLNATAILSASEKQLVHLVHRFVNDSYWFDQLACSSPRMIIWVGPNDAARRASAAFFSMVENELVAQSKSSFTSTTISKLVSGASLLAEGVAAGMDWSNNLITRLDVSTLEQFPRESIGGGFFCEFGVPTLKDLLPYINTKDQTITHFGFDYKDLVDFARELGGRGIDRIVPVGNALNFHMIWDGFDLIGRFSRAVHVQKDQEWSSR